MRTSWSLFIPVKNNKNFQTQIIRIMKKLLSTVCVLCLTFVNALAQESTVKVKVKEGAKPEVYIDGKKFDYSILDLIDQEKIAEMNVYKGAKAMEKYNAPNGAIVITTKKGSNDDLKTEDKERNSKDKKLFGDGDNDPLIIVDGLRVSKQQLKKLSPDSIDNVNILKGKQAMEEYNAPNGVIIVETKSGKKKKKVD